MLLRRPVAVSRSSLSSLRQSANQASSLSCPFASLFNPLKKAKKTRHFFPIMASGVLSSLTSVSSISSDIPPNQSRCKLGDQEKVSLSASDDLNGLGYQQEMPRSRGLFHILFMAISCQAPLYALSAPIINSLIGGGPATMIWGWILVACLTQTLAWSLGEICSIYPTSAGAYYWSFRLASPKHRVLLSWINGWLTVVGFWTISLSVTFGTAQLIVSGIGIWAPGWSAAAWHSYLIFVGVTFFASVVCIFGNRFLPKIDLLCVIWTTVGTIVILVCLLTKAASGRHSASFAFGHFDGSHSGWASGWTFFIGLLPSVYNFGAIGMITTMSEEVKNPAVNIPKAMSLSVPIGAVCGLLFILPLAFTLPDIATLLALPSRQPIGLLFEAVMGSKAGGFGLWFIVFGTAMFCAISLATASSRATWTFARDRAIPGYHFFSQVSPRFDNLPLNAFLLSTIVQILLGILVFGSTVALNAFIGVGVMCIGSSNALPVFISLVGGRRKVQDAPYSLGRWGFVVNTIAVGWIAFTIVLFSMPTVVPVTAASTNYASVVFVAFGIISAGWYFIGGKNTYVGPNVPGSEGDELKQMKSEDL